TTVSAYVGRAAELGFTITSGAATHKQEDFLILVRPPVVGGGAFTMPKAPVMVIYDPPPDKRARNNPSSTESGSLGVSTTLSFSGTETVRSNFLTPGQLASRWTSSLSLIASQYDGFVAAGGAGKGLDSFTTPIGQLIAALPSGSYSSSDVTQTS